MSVFRPFIGGVFTVLVLSSGCAVATVDEVQESDSEQPEDVDGPSATGGSGVVVVTSSGGTQSASSGGTAGQATGGSDSSDGAGGDESSGGGDGIGSGGMDGAGGSDGSGGSEGTGGGATCTTVSSCGYSSGDIGTQAACWTIPAIGKNWEMSSGAGCMITNNGSPVTASALQAERSSLSAGTLQFEGCDNDWAAWTCW